MYPCLWFHFFNLILRPSTSFENGLIHNTIFGCLHNVEAMQWQQIQALKCRFARLTIDSPIFSHRYSLVRGDNVYFEDYFQYGSFKALHSLKRLIRLNSSADTMITGAQRVCWRMKGVGGCFAKLAVGKWGVGENLPHFHTPFTKELIDTQT